jgi:hypothetical protein
MTWKALNAADAGLGSPNIDYDRFAARWETDPILKTLVDKFDENGLVIKTNSMSQQPAQGSPKAGKSDMETAAIRATRAGDLA